MTPIVGIVGWKNAGKTQLVTRLVEIFTDRGLSVSTLKHAHHDFDIDVPGKDSYQHRAAGAREVLVASGARWALMHELKGKEEPPLDSLLKKFSPADLIIVEGFKRHAHPKIEVHRAGQEAEFLFPNDPDIVAIASDETLTETGKCALLPLNHPLDVVDFIQTRFHLTSD